MIRVTDYNIDTLKLELNKETILFLTKEGVSVYAESRIVYLKGKDFLYSFNFEEIEAPKTPTVEETVTTIQTYLDPYINIPTFEIGDGESYFALNSDAELTPNPYITNKASGDMVELNIENGDLNFSEEGEKDPFLTIDHDCDITTR